MPYYKSTQGRDPMFKLQLRYNNEGEFIDTVYPPLEYARALALLKQYRNQWGNTHTYQIIPTGASK